MAVQAAGSTPRARVAPWNDPVIRGWVFQIVVVGLVGLLAWYLVSNTMENLQRQKIREMMQDWDRRYPGRTESVFTAMQNVVPSHLADAGLFDFKGLSLDTEVAEGDIAFDQEELPMSGTIPLSLAI